MAHRVFVPARVISLLCLVGLLASAAPAQLEPTLRSIASRASLGEHGIAGIAVYDMVSGAPIFTSNGDIPLAPASNQKLLTSAAAVKILGPEFEFVTSLHRGENDSLVLIGSGDPAFADPEVLKERDPPISPEDVIRSLASGAAASAGTVSELIVDDRIFDRDLIHPDWPTDQLEKWYCAPVQGVNVHANVLAFYPEPVGEIARAEIEPTASWIDINNRASVVSSGRNAIWIQRTETDQRFVLRGSIRTRAGAPIEVSMHEPALMAGRLLADRASAAGLRFVSESPTAHVRLPEINETVRVDPEALAAWTTPMHEVAYRCNYDSMNMYAEALLKRIGHEITGERGSWQNGSAVMRMLVADTLGANAAAGTVIRDGSGLSRENRITADTLARWLMAMYKNPEVRDMYIDTLPSYENKLARRLTLGETTLSVHAKTGTINRVRCLSGYVLDEETGRAAAFAILCNGLRTGEAIRGSYELKSEIIKAIDANRMELALPEVAEPVQQAQPETEALIGG